jgi:hypothetical protein
MGFGVTEAIQAGTEVAKSIAEISDIKKRREFEQNFSMLTAAQQQKLNEQLARTNTQSDRLKIMVDAFTQIKIAQSGSKDKKELILGLAIAGAGISLLVMAIIIKNKK